MKIVLWYGLKGEDNFVLDFLRLGMLFVELLAYERKKVAFCEEIFDMPLTVYDKLTKSLALDWVDC